MASTTFALGWGNQPRVELSPGGHFVAPGGAAPVGAVQPADLPRLGDGLYRMAFIIDDQIGNPFKEAKVTQARMIEAVAATAALLDQVAGEVAGLDRNQVLQLRSSGGLVLLSMLESQKGKTSEKARRLVKTAAERYLRLLEEETHVTLAEKLAVNLDWALPSLPPDLVPRARAAMEQRIPQMPPYTSWLAGGSDVLRIEWKCGSEFLDGWRRRLKEVGFTADPPGPWGEGVLRKTFSVAGVVTRVEMTLGPERSDVFRKMDDPSVHVVGYDGHSDWGRKIPASLTGAPPQRGEKAVLYLLCCGKQILQKVRDAYPRAHVVTTFNSARFTHDFSYSEDFTAFVHILEGLARRESWDQIRARVNKDWYNNPEKNYIFPNETLAMARSLDQDHDGQTDIFDRLLDFNTFDVPADAAREFSPIVPETPAARIVGTRLHLGVQVFHTLAHFNQVLERFTRELRVNAGGWFDPSSPGAPGVVERGPTRVTVARGAGPVHYSFQGSTHFAHASAEAWRALATLALGPVVMAQEAIFKSMPASERALHTLMMVAQGLEVDDAPFGRDAALWKGVLGLVGLPEIPLWEVQTAKKADSHWYAGSRAGVEHLQRVLSPDLLKALGAWAA